jgi:hypothetical protein
MKMDIPHVFLRPLREAEKLRTMADRLAEVKEIWNLSIKRGKSGGRKVGNEVAQGQISSFIKRWLNQFLAYHSNHYLFMNKKKEESFKENTMRFKPSRIN